jgi:hypothetical protein
MPGDAGAAFWNAYNQSAQRVLQQKAFQEESAIRALQRQRLQQQLSEEQALPNDISAVLRASQGGNVPVLQGTQTPVEPTDVSDLAGQNLLDLKQMRAPQTLPELSQSVPADVLARVVQHRPQVFGALGLRTPQAVESENLQKSGLQELGNLFATAKPAMTPEEARAFSVKALGIATRGNLGMADDMTKAVFKMFTEAPDDSGKVLGSMAKWYRTGLEAGNSPEVSLLDALGGAIKENPTGGKHWVGVYDKFSKSVRPERQTPQTGHVVGKGASYIPPGATQPSFTNPSEPKTAKQQADEDMAIMRRDNMRAVQNAGNIIDAIDAGKEVPVKEVRLHINTLRPMLTSYEQKLSSFDPNITPEDKDFYHSEIKSIQGTIKTLTDYLNRKGNRPMPGRDTSGDVGAGRPQQTASVQPAAVDPATAEQQRQRYLTAVAKLYPNKTWQQLNPGERQRVADTVNRGE